MIHYSWVIALTGTLVLLLSQGFGRLAPAALGFITLLFGIAQSLGPAVAGWIKDATGNFTWCFILSAAVSLLGAASTTMLKRKEYASVLR